MGTNRPLTKFCLLAHHNLKLVGFLFFLLLLSTCCFSLSFPVACLLPSWCQRLSKKACISDATTFGLELKGQDKRSWKPCSKGSEATCRVQLWCFLKTKNRPFPSKEDQMASPMEAPETWPEPAPDALWDTDPQPCSCGKRFPILRQPTCIHVEPVSLCTLFLCEK